MENMDQKPGRDQAPFLSKYVNQDKLQRDQVMEFICPIPRNHSFKVYKFLVPLGMMFGLPWYLLYDILDQVTIGHMALVFGVGLAFALFYLYKTLWGYAGREIIRLDEMTLTVESQLLRLNKSRRFNIEHLEYVKLNKDYKINRTPPGQRTRTFAQTIGYDVGFIEIGYARGTQYLASGVSRQEALELIELIQDHPLFKEDLVANGQPSRPNPLPDIPLPSAKGSVFSPAPILEDVTLKGGEAESMVTSKFEDGLAHYYDHERSKETGHQVYTCPIPLTRFTSLRRTGVLAIACVLVPRWLSEFLRIEGFERLLPAVVPVALLLILTVVFKELVAWYGKEVLVITDQQVVVENRLGPLAWKRKFSFKDINGIRLNVHHQPARNMRTLGDQVYPHQAGYDYGFVLIEYKKTVHKCGSALTMEEANSFIELIKAHKNYVPDTE